MPSCNLCRLLAVSLFVFSSGGVLFAQANAQSPKAQAGVVDQLNPSFHLPHISEMPDGKLRTEVTNPDGSVSISVLRQHPGGQPASTLAPEVRIQQQILAIEMKWQQVLSDEEMTAIAEAEDWFNTMSGYLEALQTELDLLNATIQGQ